MGEGASARVTARVPGSALVGLRYERPFDDLDPPHGADGWRVVPASYVTTEEGTGLVHLAPAFGEIDRQIGRENGLPSLNPVGSGRRASPTRWRGWPGGDVREANHDINDRLESAGLLLRRFPYVHSYPHCWRCRTPLIYWGKPSWYIATSTRKDDLLAANQHGGLAPRPHPATGASASGSRTTSTGRCRVTATGGRRCRSGAAAAGTCAASAR